MYALFPLRLVALVIVVGREGIIFFVPVMFVTMHVADFISRRIVSYVVYFYLISIIFVDKTLSSCLPRRVVSLKGPYRPMLPLCR